MKSDDELQSDVRAALTTDGRVKGNEIGVIAKNGAVTLNGNVETYADRLAAEQAAKSVEGVRAIAQGIAVENRDEHPVTDERIAERIARLSSGDPSLRDTRVLAEVRSGFVTLTGDVELPSQKQDYEDRVAGLDGIVGISNRITIRKHEPSLKASDVVQQIVSALHRHPDVDASSIRVSVAGAKVALEGTIPTQQERELVEDAIWAMAGVDEIDNQLRVGPST
jgi:osmotically-inducible protein OsmY